MLKTALDILATSGRIMFYGKGLCRCIKEVVTITLKIYNATDGSLGSSITKEIIELNEF